MGEEGVRKASHKQGSGSSQHPPQGSQGSQGMNQLAVKCEDNAIIYQLHRPYSHLQKLGSRMRMLSFDFSGTLNTIQLLLFGEKLKALQVDSMASWITD